MSPVYMYKRKLCHYSGSMEDKRITKAEGVIFDMDGILFDTEQVYQKYWHQIADEMGITLGEDWVRSITGTNGAYLISIVEKFYHTDNGRAILEECVRRASESLTKEVPVKKGVREILSFLKEQGIKTAVASSSAKAWIERYLSVAGISEYFDEVVSGDEVSHGKPAPDIFLLASSRIGIAPQNCIVFEDSFNGVRAGHASGATTVMIPDLLQPTDEIRGLADEVCGSFLSFLEEKDRFF